MSALRRFIARIANLLFPGRADRALARELRSHVAFLEDEYRSRGLSLDDARRSAAHALGGWSRPKSYIVTPDRSTSSAGSAAT